MTLSVLSLSPCASQPNPTLIQSGQMMTPPLSQEKISSCREFLQCLGQTMANQHEEAGPTVPPRDDQRAEEVGLRRLERLSLHGFADGSGDLDELIQV